MTKNNVPFDWGNMIARLEATKGLDETAPPKSFHEFLNSAQTLYSNKDIDYDSRYLRALISLDARTIWTWEVEKKLDRLRTWIKRGELQVKGEGIRNSVDDLFVYTVQYFGYVQQVINFQLSGESFLAAVQNSRPIFFRAFATRLKPVEWVEFLELKGLIKPEEFLLKNILRLYMGDKPDIKDWKDAIRKILDKK
ncbi:hypothetical protein [Cytobacillus horneckiae]|uniref:hypothetical protein n=1 Tax=Cytobacillus horneckiae TaxID=549687 RepID=UPI003D9A1091